MPYTKHTWHDHTDLDPEIITAAKLNNLETQYDEIVADYLDQAVKTGSSPSFAGLTLTGALTARAIQTTHNTYDIGEDAARFKDLYLQGNLVVAGNVDGVDVSSFKSAYDSHNHDAAYAAIGHNHDSAYAALGHNHDSAYAAASHNHDSAYISIVGTPTSGNFPTLTAGGELADSAYGPTSFATAGHNHDAAYAAISHNHAASEITSGTLDGDRLPAMSTTKLGGVPATGTPSGKYLKDDGTWAAITAGTGDVTGPAGATDNAIARYDAATGKLLQDSLVTVDDTGNVNIPTGAAFRINGVAHTHDYAASSHNHDSAYISIVSTPTNGNIPLLNASGELVNSAYAPSSFATSGHNHDTAYVAKNTAITGATNCKITYDAKGLVTGGTTLAVSDLPTVTVAKGGTGLTTIAAGGILYASSADTLSRIAPSAANQVLRSSAANAAAWGALVAADIPSLDTSKLTTGTLGTARGGTGLASFTAGSVLYASSTSVIAQAAPTAANQVLKSSAANAFAWGALAAADLPTITYSKTDFANQALLNSSSPTFAGLTVNGNISNAGNTACKAICVPPIAYSTSTLQYSNDAEFTNSGTTERRAKAFTVQTIIYGANIYFTAEVYNTGGALPVRILVNGVEKQTATWSGAASYASRNISLIGIKLEHGDLVELMIKSSGAYTYYLRNFRMFFALGTPTTSVAYTV